MSNKELIGAADAPVSAATIPLLMQAVSSPDASIARIAEVVASDAGLAARILSLANSAAFGLARQVTDVNQAVSLVGSNLCQTVAIAGACDLLDGRSGLRHVRAHAVTMACTTRALGVRVGLNKSDAFAAGLLHDLGEILLWRQDPPAYLEAYETWTDPEAQLRGERAMFGTDHAVAARNLLAEWHLPGTVVDAVGDHHRPDPNWRDLSTAVIAAEELHDDDVEWSNRFELFELTPADLPEFRSDVLEQAAEVGGLLSAA